MALNPLASISSITTGISSAGALLSGVTSIANLLAAVPQAQGYAAQKYLANVQGGPGTANYVLEKPLLFHYEGEQSFSLQSDITDYAAEDNTSLQDQIALQPEEITTQGFIGELTDIPPTIALAVAAAAANKLTNISGYLPSLSETALIAYDEAFFAYQTGINAVNSAASAVSSLGSNVLGLPVQSKQQSFFQQFYQYWINRRLFTIQTPWQVMNNMAIKSLRAIQESDTVSVSTFEVTFKKMRFASTQLVNQSTAFNRADQAKSAIINGGSSSATPVATTPQNIFALIKT